MPNHESEEYILLLFFLLSVVLGAEYYLFIQPEIAWPHPLVQKLAGLMLQLGIGLRIAWILLYVLFLRLFRSPSYLNREPKSIPLSLKLVAGFTFILIAGIFFTIQYFNSYIIYYLYPASLLGIITITPILMGTKNDTSSVKKWKTEKRKNENQNSIHIKSKSGWINVVNPFRGTLVIGSSGSGKSASIGNAFLHQFIKKKYCGIVYDFKFPTLADEVNTALHLNDKNASLKYYILNFHNPSLSHRCNPLAPANIPTASHAEEYARAIINNLDTNTIRHRDFFSNSAIAWLSALIWFYKSKHPEFCTLPHVINTALYKDYTHVVSMLETHPQSADMIRSIATAIKNKAEKQIAGVVASLQIMVGKINTPEIVWVLTGNDCDLNINDPVNPKLLCLGSDPGRGDTFSPVISLIITVALKQMNQQGKHKSFVLLDEAPTLYIPKFEVIPATARSNKISSVYMAQDFSQMYDMLGRDKAEVIIANLSNQFYGKVSSVHTAKVVSEMIGKEERPITGYSQSRSKGASGNNNITFNTNTSMQQRHIVNLEQVMQLQRGEFIGQTVETGIPYFWGPIRIMKTKYHCNIFPFSDLGNREDRKEILECNFKRIRQDVEKILKDYPNEFIQSDERK